MRKSNPALKGALPDNYYSCLQLDTAKLASLLDEINRINTDDKENDIIGRIYEYFSANLRLPKEKARANSYTPKCIVNLIAEMLEPYDGILYDPCCGSGGMFAQSMEFVEAHHGNKKEGVYLRAGIYQYHFQTVQDEPCHSWHFRKSRRNGGQTLSTTTSTRI